MYVLEKFNPIWKLVLFIVAMSAACVECQSPYCTEDAATCCECITMPGCSWSALTDSSQPRCTSGPSTPLVNELLVHVNRPFNPHRKRYVRPQHMQLKIALGVRKEVEFEVLAQRRRVRLIIIGPTDSPNFSVEREGELSCAHRFRVRQRTSSPRQGGSNRRPLNRRPRASTSTQKRITIDCLASAAGEVQKLKLVVDMNKCYEATKEIRIGVRERGARKIKVDVSSSCMCPCESSDTDENQGVCGEGEEAQQCVTGDATDDSMCSSVVNNYCRMNENATTCSGHGTCLCGNCLCDEIHSDRYTNEDHTPVQRYRGRFCECDDTQCPKFNNLICGGPDRGMCHCGSCQCRGEFYGEACEEADSAETCMGPGGEICNNQGECVYGRCVCRGSYVGHYCEDCPTCPSMCNRLAPCAECKALAETEIGPRNCTSECSIFPNSQVSYVLSDDNQWPDSAQQCSLPLQNSCQLFFGYEMLNNWDLVVYHQTEIFICPEQG